jgi:hypothetical protein
MISRDNVQCFKVFYVLSCPLYYYSLEVEVNLRPMVSRSVCLGVRLPSGAHDQIFVFCLMIAGLLLWGALSDERMDLWFTCTIASGPCQSTHSWVKVLQNSRPYFTVSKLQTDLLAIQNWFKKWRMKANESKSIHVTFTTRRETCHPFHINNVQLPQGEDVKYHGLHLDRRLTWHKHIFAKRKQLGITLTKMYWLLGRKSKLSTSNKLLICKTILKQIWTYGIQLLGYGFHFQHRNSRMFTIESLAHDSGLTLVCAEHGYPKESPNTNS